ncbi:hypothetical protein Lste_2418 [Legionella steelei]|uniref:Uncharacterized protein n=1 Tax=Legionella steelei TaxID=947033 RepID=A0A0W0ZIM8_9GAMM|nr:hypothetical protein [Legionella steelei]KTD69260.1 hypothetical protein Lste_2418 [Legionella steelei]
METLLDNVKLLKQIMKIQTVFASAHLDQRVFIQLAVNEVHKITPATETVVELVQGSFMVYKAMTGTVTDYHELKLPIEKSISGRCILTNQVLISHDKECIFRRNNLKGA